jgi:enamine deaminase RidA (YjgF/YER057c/UK114 family)
MTPGIRNNKQRPAAMRASAASATGEGDDVMNDPPPRPSDGLGDETNDKELAAGLAATPGYRYADPVGDELFVAGQVPLDGDGNLTGRDDPAAQARACLDNLRTLVSVHEFGIGDVRHLTIYVVGEHRHLLEAWRAITEWFAAPVPPATLLGVNLLGHSDQLVEIDATIRRHPSP